MKTVSSNLWITPPASQPGRTSLAPSSFLNQFTLGQRHTLLFNGLTGAIDILDAEELHRLTTLTWTPLQQEEETYLQARGYLISPGSEGDLVDELLRRTKLEASRQGVTFFLSPTNYCSMGCRYCLEGQLPKAHQRRAMTQEQVDAAWDAMASLCNKAGKTINYLTLFGGEPLQDFTLESVEAILEGAATRTVKVLVFTNGLSIDRFAPLLAKHREHILAIHTTIDGPAVYHDQLRGYPNAFAHTRHAVDRLLELSLPVMIRTNLTRSNCCEIPELKRIYQDFGWWDNPMAMFELSPITNHGDDPTLAELELPHHEHALAFLRLLEGDPSLLQFRHVGLFSHLYYLLHELEILRFELHDMGFNNILPRVYGCSANAQTGYALCSDGTIHHCNEDSGDAAYQVGTFWPKFRIDAHASEPWLNRSVDQLPTCLACSYRFVCAGGCSRQALRANRDLALPVCGSVREDFRHTVEALTVPILAKWGLA